MRGLKWSLCVHAVLLSLLAARGCGKPLGAENLKQGQEDAQSEQEAKDKLAQADQTLEVDIIPPPKMKDGITKAEEDGVGEAAHATDECDNFFGGIGIEEFSGLKDPNDLRSVGTFVEKVYEGYPAKKAGLLPMDEILNSKEIRGEIGSKVVVRTLRQGRERDYTIIRDKICTTPPKHKGEKKP